MKRYAIYYAPQVSSPWWSTWSEWLGRDASSGVLKATPLIDGLDQDVFNALVKEPARYGLHATIKAPFKLGLGIEIENVSQRLQGISQQQKAFELKLKLEKFRNFYALTPIGDVNYIQELANQVVIDMDDFRLSLTEEELNKRRLNGLSPLEDQMLIKWGYPYVLDCFRFHISLSGHLEGLDTRYQELIENAIEQRLQVLSEIPLMFDSLCLFEEPNIGADFYLKERFTFGG